MSNFTPQQIEEFLQEFFDVVGARQYIGARYVPIFGRAGEDTIEWDDGAPYEPLTVVMHEGISYVSRRYVPRGIQVTDTDYWAQTYRFNAQVEQYRQQVLSFQGQIDDLRADLESDYVPFPDPAHLPKYGDEGQVLTTLANGETKWEDPVIPSDEQAEAIITDWLDEHPEATTTVVDGSLTWEKLTTSLQNRLLHGAQVNIHSGVRPYPFDGADNQPMNSVAFVMANVGATSGFPGLPVYGQYGILAKINYDTRSEHGFIQVYATTEKCYLRMEWGSGETYNYGDWHELNDVPITWDKLATTLQDRVVHSSHILINANVTPYPFDGANEQPMNSVAFVSINVEETSGFPDLPVYGQYGVLAKMNHDTRSEHGFVQVYSTTTQCFIRTEWGSGDDYHFGDWLEINNVIHDGSVTWDMLATTLQDRIVHSSHILINANVTPYPFDGANEQPMNSIAFVVANVEETSGFPDLPVYGQFGVLAKLNHDIRSEHGFVQVYSTTTQCFVRMEWGSGDTYNYGQWMEVFNRDDLTRSRTCDIFRKVVCCGDSYTSGHISQGGQTIVTNEDYAWPHYMETITGNTYVNCGHSGATVLSWLTDTRGLPKAQASGQAQAYIVGLMLNDIGRVPVGTATDIGDENPTTFYGGMAKIVRELKAISPDAFVFLQTCPRTESMYDPYNEAVRTIASTYASTYDTHLLDLHANRRRYQIPSITQDFIGGHYTAIGYQQFAMILADLLSEYIDTHVSTFQGVHTIPIS